MQTTEENLTKFVFNVYKETAMNVAKRNKKLRNFYPTENNYETKNQTHELW